MVYEEIMLSGRHTHFCFNCQKDIECPQITHCKLLAVAPCIDCRAAAYAKHESGFVEGRAEQAYYETGKWPKE